MQLDVARQSAFHLRSDSTECNKTFCKLKSTCISKAMLEIRSVTDQLSYSVPPQSPVLCACSALSALKTLKRSKQ